jgi:hypothetical protein
MGQIVFALIITICEGWNGDDWIDIKKSLEKFLKKKC